MPQNGNSLQQLAITSAQVSTGPQGDLQCCKFQETVSARLVWMTCAVRGE